MDLIGKMIERVMERRMAGRDTYKDYVTWTETTLYFSDGTDLSFGSSDVEVYDPFEYRDIDDDGTPVPAPTCRGCGETQTTVPSPTCQAGQPHDFQQVDPD